MSTVNKSPWQAIGFVLSCLMSISFVVGSWVMGWFTSHEMGVDAATHHFTITVIALLWAAGVLFTAFCQIVAFGQQGVNAQTLYRLGVRRGTLRNAVVFSNLLTPSGIATYLMLVGIVGQIAAHFASGFVFKTLVWLLTLICSACAVIFASLVMSSIATAATVLIRSRHARNIITGLFILFILLASQSGSFIGAYIGSLENSANSADVAESAITLAVEFMGTVMQWTPLSSATVLPVMMTRPTAMTIVFVLVSVIVYAAAFWLLCMAFDWCLRRDIVMGQTIATDKPKTQKVRGLGFFSLHAARGQFGGIIARLATSWLRDVRYGISLLLPLFFVVIFAFQGIMLSKSGIVLMAVPLSGYFMSLIGINMLAYDGPAFIMHTMSGVKGRIDWYARSVFQLALGLAMQLLITVIALVISRGIKDIEIFAALELVGLCLLLTGIANSAVLSPLLMFPVPSADQPMKTPQGRTMMQMFIPMLWMLLMLVPFIPGVAVGGLGWWIIRDEEQALRIAFVAQLVISTVYFFVGNEISGRMTDKRRLKIQDTLRRFAELTR